jgi:hypothetical protein
VIKLPLNSGKNVGLYYHFAKSAENFYLICDDLTLRAGLKEERERYDNNQNTCSAIASLLSAAIAIITQPSLQTLFILALIAGIVDNFFYFYIYECIRKRPEASDERKKSYQE